MMQLFSINAEPTRTASPWHPACLASTDVKGAPTDHSNGAVYSPSRFQAAAWSPDGAHILSSDPHTLSSFAISKDILNTPRARPLRPETRSVSPSPIRAFAATPYFGSDHDAYAHVVVGTVDRPIQLINMVRPIEADPEPRVGDADANIAVFKHVHPTTERYICPYSLAFSNNGTHFLSGSENCIAIFDMSGSQDRPAHTIVTTPSQRKKALGNAMGFTGIVTAIEIGPDGVLAVGTTTREIAMYASEGWGDLITHFQLPDREGGAGVSQIQWSPCGQYLYVAERCSDALWIYDSRSLAACLGFTAGRKALTTQKLGFDMVPGRHGYEVWAGGTDGMVRVWKGTQWKEGQMDADDQWCADEDAVVSTRVHYQAPLVMTAAGKSVVADPGGGSSSSSSSDSSDSSDSDSDSDSDSGSVSNGDGSRRDDSDDERRPYVLSGGADTGRPRLLQRGGLKIWKV